MKPLTSHIEYLLSRHDCVVVPGLGAFVKHYENSEISADFQVITSPKISIGFNQEVNHNDGLLVTSVMRCDAVSYEVAARYVEREVTSMLRLLSQGDEIPMGRIGLLRSSSEGKTTFRQFPCPTLGNEWFGLNKKLTVRPLLEILSEQEKGTVTQPLWVAKARKIATIAASIVVLVFLSLVLSTPISHNGLTSAEMAGLNKPFDIHQAQTESPVCQEPNIELRFTSPKAVEKPAVAEQEPVATETGRYYLIVSSLESERQAKKFISGHDGDNLQVLNVEGKYRVYIARSDDFEALSAQRAQVDAQYPGAWIFKARR